MFIQFRAGRLAAVLAVLLLLSCAAAGSGAVLRAGTRERAARVPVLMYHSVCVNERAGGEYVLPPAVFRADLEYLKNAGYTPVFLAELAAFAAGEGTLPEKPVAITLDDGFLNSLTEVLPVLEALDWKAEINVVGAYMEAEENAAYRSPAYSYLNAAELRALLESGRFELGSHTYALHGLKNRRGCAPAPGEAAGDYRRTLLADAARQKDAVFAPLNVRPWIFAYPYGAFGADTRRILTDAGYSLFLTCEEKINEISPGEPLTTLGRINRPASMTTEAFMRENGI